MDMPQDSIAVIGCVGAEHRYHIGCLVGQFTVRDANAAKCALCRAALREWTESRFPPEQREKVKTLNTLLARTRTQVSTGRTSTGTTSTGTTSVTNRNGGGVVTNLSGPLPLPPRQPPPTPHVRVPLTPIQQRNVDLQFLSKAPVITPSPTASTNIMVVSVKVHAIDQPNLPPYFHNFRVVNPQVTIGQYLDEALQQFRQTLVASVPDNKVLYGIIALPETEPLSHKRMWLCYKGEARANQLRSLTVPQLPELVHYYENHLQRPTTVKFFITLSR